MFNVYIATADINEWKLCFFLTSTDTSGADHDESTHLNQEISNLKVICDQQAEEIAALKAEMDRLKENVQVCSIHKRYPPCT